MVFGLPSKTQKRDLSTGDTKRTKLLKWFCNFNRKADFRIPDMDKSMQDNSPIPIREIYRGYAPPIDATNVTLRLLRSVPEKYLKGLGCVVLTNQSGLSRKYRVGKVWRKNKKMLKTDIGGLYHPRRQTEPPWIELYVDRMFESFRRALYGYRSCETSRWALFSTTSWGTTFIARFGRNTERKKRPQIIGPRNFFKTTCARLIGFCCRF
jgi:hypothetical protein